jgi:hypothetical protein
MSASALAMSISRVSLSERGYADADRSLGRPFREASTDLLDAPPGSFEIGIREPVTAVAHDPVRGAQLRFERDDDGLQQRVPRGVARAVVELFEPVDVDERQRERLV